MFKASKRMRVPLHPHHASDIPNDPTPADQAIYMPAITPGYSLDVARAIQAGVWHRQLSDGVTPQEMNFLGTDTQKEFTLRAPNQTWFIALRGDGEAPCQR
jgi:hypothetical protein